MQSRYASAEWLELSGLPAEMNDRVRQHSWVVFKKIVELDCKRNRRPEAVEISLGELGSRCGLDPERVGKIAEALSKKKYLACFIPDNEDESGLFQVRVPIRTPRSAEEVALAATDPQLRDPATFRYATADDAEAPDESKVQHIVDLYLNSLSQKMNSFIVDEIEIIAQRFPLGTVEKMMRRASKLEIRSIGWVTRELIREAKKTSKKKKDAPGKVDPQEGDHRAV